MHKGNTSVSLITTLLLSFSHINASFAADPVNVSASSDDGNIPQNTLDNDPDTRWSALGDGQYIRYDLGQSFSIDSIDISFFKGDQRTATFDVQTSSDENNWTTVFSGDQPTLTLSQQNIALSASEGQYLQIVGYGNSSNNWNSITEIDINTSAVEPVDPIDPVDPVTPTPTASASTDDGNVPSNVLDEDPGTRWSALGNGQWLALDLGGTFNVNGVELAFFKGDQRSANFDIEVSSDGSNWNTVLSNEFASGSSLDLEPFNFAEVSASHVRYVGYGNSANNWNSLTEMRVSTNGGDGGGPIDPIDPIDPVDPTDPVTGDTYNATPDSLNDVLATVNGGDEVIVTGSGEISLKNYDFSTPVLIRAPSIGGTTLTNATITNSNNLILQGFVFGPNDESTLLKIVNSTNISVLRNLFDHKDITESQTSIVMTQASRYINIGYNEFRDKNLGDNNGSKITGSFIKTQFDDPLMTRDLRIYRNHFNNIAPYISGSSPAGDSDREAIAMGIADSQDVDTNNIVEYNLFENCDGENEIITVKTSSNIFRYNTFKNSMGSLSLRLGSNSEVYGNYFYGLGSGGSVSNDNYQTGGVRVYGSGHSIYDNYMENLTGISWRRPILIDSGDVNDSTGNDSHETSTNIFVGNNTIVDSTGGGIHIGSDNYGNQPKNIDITNNVVVSDEGILFNNHANQSSNTWSGNEAYATGSAQATDGGSLSNSEVNVLSNQPSINAPTPLSASDVGRYAN